MATVLLTGATGYVGGRLLPRLVDAGHEVRCLVRDPERLHGRPGASGAQIVRGDVLDATSLRGTFDGVDTLYYLVHSMGAAGGFEEADRQAARNVIDEARRAGVKSLIYLGGLGRAGEADSPHLRSRHEVGQVLRGSGIPTIELRASIIIGPGSLSFDLVRSLVERLPLMITPRWVRSLAQPIHIDDVIAYLVASLDVAPTTAAVDIGGPDQVSYSDLMHEYARQRGLRRRVWHVPFLTARLSSLWLGLVTPVYARIGRKLIDSLRHDTIVENDSAQRLFPRLKPVGVSEAVAYALRDDDAEIAGTRWMDALSASPDVPPWTGVRRGRRRLDSRRLDVNTDPAALWTAIERIGGRTGWYYGDWMWQLRGWIDLAVGGPGMRRGRRDRRHLLVGDTVDCWRVERVEAGRLLRLQAQMRLPGRAWLQFEVEPQAEGCRLQQTAIYDPVGALGILYWWAVAPLHHFVFGGMLRGLAASARERADRQAEREPTVARVPT